MESKLNHKAIEAYAKTYTQAVLNDFFEVHDTINGKQILALPGLHQVNLFVVRLLFKQWKDEIQNLESPYFNYKSKPVKKALNDFMNVLSHNIAIKKKHFSPLMRAAITDALLLIFSPYEFYSKEVSGRGQSRISRSGLKELAKYVKINKGLLVRVINHFEESGIKEAFADEGQRILDEVCEASPEIPEDIEPYLNDFNEVSPLRPDQIYEDVPAASPAAAPAPEKVAPAPTAAPTAAPAPEPAAEQPPVAAAEPPTPAPVHEEAPQTAGQVLHDTLKTEEEPVTLAESLAQKSIDSIKKNITINQRYMFVNELFGNDIESFDKAITHLEGLTNFDAAVAYLKETHATPFEWDWDGEVVQEVLQVLAKRYGA